MLHTVMSGIFNLLFVKTVLISYRSRHFLKNEQSKEPISIVQSGYNLTIFPCYDFTAHTNLYDPKIFGIGVKLWNDLNM